LWAKKMGCKKIFVNTHHLHSTIDDFLKQKKNLDIEIIHEEILLDTGGALYNLKRKMNLKKGTILVIAGDQFYFFERSIWNNALEKVKRSHGVLFGLTVNGWEDSYNELCLKDMTLKKIENYSKNAHRKRAYVTYSGLSLINLEMLDDNVGPSPFFKSVANYSEKDILVLIPENQEYWDFGSSERYYKSIKKLFEHFMLRKKSEFLNFSLENMVIDFSKVSKKLESYGDFERAFLFNFGKVAHYDFFALMNTDLGKSFSNIKGPGLYYRDIFDQVADKLQ